MKKKSILKSAVSIYIAAKIISMIKFVVTKIEEIFSINLTLATQLQIGGEDFIKFCGLLRKNKL